MVQIIIREKILSQESFALIKPQILELAASESLMHAGEKNGVELSIIVSDDQEILELNRTFRGLENVTDVLSFPAGEIDPDTGLFYLGDVVISFPQAIAQANSAGHSVEYELQLLVVHGVLHLLGFDHDEEEDRLLMWDIQKKILSRLGCDVDF